MTNKPTHIVYHVKDAATSDDGEPPRGFWTKVGAAWQHNDEKGFSIVFDVMWCHSTGGLWYGALPDDRPTDVKPEEIVNG